MKLRKKLLVVFLILASLVGLIGYVAIKSLKEINSDVDQIRQSSILEVESSAAMAFELIMLNSLLKEYLSEKINRHAEGTNRIKKEIETSFTRFEKQIALRKKITSDGFTLYVGEELQEEKEELGEMEEFQILYRSYKEDILKNITGFEKDAYITGFRLHEHEWDERARTLIGEARSFMDDAQVEITDNTVNVAAQTKRSTGKVIIIAVLAFLAALVIGIFATRSITIPLSKLNSAAKNIALGKMILIENIKTKDEIGDLAISFNTMTAELKKSKTKIEDYNKSLEQKVHDRTQALEVNILALQETEKKLQGYTSDLKNSNLELEQFAYVASHDLQEPLRTIVSFVELLKKQYEGKLDAKADKYLAFIEQSSGRMKTLIHDLLTYSKIGNKKELQDVDCNAVLQEVKDDLHKNITDEQAVIETAELPVIKGYRVEMKQLFQNLIINAIKFRKKGIIPHLTISARKDNSSWIFGVQDNGIGIAKEHQEKVFTIFQRLHNKTEYEGTGIGLAHCKKIIGLHKGKIWIESTPGEGTTFYFNIPLNNN